ncbi:MAG: hypothetical protein KY468_03830 [Armatimonadetes bacterium]|nr:hypothetical protein [Armatimonadota bacterium]
MGSAYTPGLKISPFTPVQTTRRLPLKGAVLATVGQAVEPDTIVARAELPGLLQTVKVAALLGLEPQDVPKNMTVHAGDRVEEGQIIAQTNSFFGLFKSAAKSPLSGVVELISEVSGNVGIRSAPQPIELTAYLKGRVVEVMPEDGVMIETEGAFVQGIFGVGGERQGIVRVCTSTPEEDLTADRIDESCRGAVVVGGRQITPEAIQKAVQAGAVALVGGCIVDRQLIDYVQHDIGVAITGQEEVPLTLIITEGFGSIPMARRTFDLLKALEGKSASVNGRTQIRAGVIRPEIIVPLSPEERPNVPPEPARQDLDLGATIRLIREPYFGRLGTVAELPAELEEIPSGAKVRVLRADLHSGERVTVPRANVEIVSG